MEQNSSQPEPSVNVIKSPKDRKNLLIFLFPIFAILFLVGAISLVVLNSKESKKTAEPAKATTIAPRTEYKNPFDKTAQYVNPFSSYKNPFDNLK